MKWKCPNDWKYIPGMKPATEGMMLALVLGDAARFRQVRAPWFRRCNASGKLIWPFQKGWTGVVAISHGNYDSGAPKGGSYAIAWLNNDQYLIQKLKGNI